MKLTTPVVVTITAALLVVIGFAVYLIGTGHDPGSYVGTVAALVALVPGLLGISVMQSKTDAKVNTIQTNTNGTLSQLRAQLQAKDSEIMALRSVATPEQIQKVAPLNPAPASAPTPPLVDPIPVSQIIGGVTAVTVAPSGNH